MCVLIFPTTFEIFLTLRRIDLDMNKNIYCCFQVKYPLFLSDFK
jgi:hypothetical protein